MRKLQIVINIGYSACNNSCGINKRMQFEFVKNNLVYLVLSMILKRNTKLILYRINNMHDCRVQILKLYLKCKTKY